MKVNTLTAIVSATDTIDALRPKTGNAVAIVRELNSMSGHQVGDLFRAIDNLVLAVKILKHEEATTFTQ